MSLELVAVLFGLDAPDHRQWQMAFARLNLPWRFEITSNPVAANGFCSMRAGSVISGVEILNDTLDGLPGHPLPGGPQRVIAFRWGGDMLEYACALAAAAALVESHGAVIHDPTEHLTRIDPQRLLAMATQVTTEALAQNSQALTVAKLVRAITRMNELDWRFVVDRRVVCRSIDGPYLRGIHVDRTSSAGVYRLRAIQTPWCMITNTVYLNHAIELRHWLRGGLNRIVDDFRRELAADEGIRRCIMADPTDPFLFDPRFYTNEENNTPHPWVERAIMRAQDGDGIGALPLLRRAIERYSSWTSPRSVHQWQIIPNVISCIERNDDVAALLHPLAEEAKAGILIKPVRPGKSPVPRLGPSQPAP